MAAGLRAALARPLRAIQPSISRLAPYRWRYWLAFMAIQLAADSAPNGARHSAFAPDTRPPVAPPPRAAAARPRVANVDSHTVRNTSTCRHRPEATASMVAMTEPPGPGRSPPPLIHVGWSRSASSTAVTPPSLIPMPPAPG